MTDHKKMTVALSGCDLFFFTKKKKMSSLANLISNIKANTASNPLVQKGQKRKIDTTEIKRPKKAKETIQKSNGPSVVVFDGSVLQKKPVYEEKAEKKRFLVIIR